MLRFVCEAKPSRIISEANCARPVDNLIKDNSCTSCRSACPLRINWKSTSWMLSQFFDSMLQINLNGKHTRKLSTRLKHWPAWCQSVWQASRRQDASFLWLLRTKEGQSEHTSRDKVSESNGKGQFHRKRLNSTWRRTTLVVGRCCCRQKWCEWCKWVESGLDENHTIEANE